MDKLKQELEKVKKDRESVEKEVFVFEGRYVRRQVRCIRSLFLQVEAALALRCAWQLLLLSLLVSW